MSRKNKDARVCVSCRQEKDKSELIRITKNFITNEAEINNDNHCHGRSVYICKNQECITKALKKQKLEYGLKVKITENIKKELDTVLKS